MSELTREAHLSVAVAVTELPPRFPVGVAFVPCAICSTALDLGVLAEADQAPLCDRHRVGDYPPF